MVKVLHHSRDGVIGLPNIKNPRFILTNKKGEFLFMSSEYNASRFEGTTYAKELGKENWAMYKIINGIRLVNEQCTQLQNNFSNIERASGNAVEKFWMTDYGLIYDVEKFVGFTELTLDIREIYDFDDKGRIYKIYPQGDLIIVEYTKYKDHDLQEINYKLFLAIKGIKEYYKTEEWQQYQYEYDRKRQSSPNELYIYNALRVGVDFNIRLCFSWSDNLDDAIKKANILHKKAKALIEDSANDFSLTKKIKDEKLKAAAKCATASVDSLAVSVGDLKGIYAGLPWFFQFWSRDELLSLRAFILQRQYEFAKGIIMKQLANIVDSGNLKNKVPNYDVESADSLGWLVLRLSELFDELRKERLIGKYFSIRTLNYIRVRIERAVLALLRSRTENGFATGKSFETWMDSDSRDGARIELQALRLRIYSFMQELCRMTNAKGVEKYKNLENGLKRRVRESFFKDNMLAEGLNDFTIRPNIFIVSYVYPHLLAKSEWEAVFDAALKKIWCGWGGLSTIDYEHPSFQPYHSGELPQSYHRGDSWFFLNHITAISMLRVNRQKFMPYVKKILEASTDDILSGDVIGHMSELSSAEKQMPEGSPCQLWSAATFIELVNEYIKN